MKIKPEQLKANLNKTTSPLVLLSGDEPYLKIECKQHMYAHFSKLQFTVEKYRVDHHFDWSNLLDDVLSPSLFSPRKLISCEFMQNKLKSEAAKQLTEIINASLNDENSVLMLDFPKLDNASSKQTWFKTVSSQGLHIEVWPIDEAQFPTWVKKELQAANLPHSNKLLNAISELTSGNLLAAKQEIKKLSLLNGDEASMIAALSAAAKYTIFDWVQQTLLGQLNKAHTIWQHLKDEAEEPILLLWALSSEIRLGIEIKQAIKQGRSWQAICQQKRIWPKRKQPLQVYLKQHSIKTCYQHLQFCNEIDQQLKGCKYGNPWFSLLQLCNRIAAGEKCVI